MGAASNKHQCVRIHPYIIYVYVIFSYEAGRIQQQQQQQEAQEHLVHSTG